MFDPELGWVQNKEASFQGTLYLVVEIKLSVASGCSISATMPFDRSISESFGTHGQYSTV
jgi:hypothetical protein